MGIFSSETKTPQDLEVVTIPKNKTSSSYFSSFDPLKSAKNAMNSASDSVNAKINAAKDSAKNSINAAKKDAKSSFFSFGNKMKESLGSAKKDLKNTSGSTFSSLKDKVKSNYQEWLKYGVFFFLIGYVLLIVVGLFGLPPHILHNIFSFLTRILDYLKIDFTSFGKPPQSDNEVEKGK